MRTIFGRIPRLRWVEPESVVIRRFGAADDHGQVAIYSQIQEPIGYVDRISRSEILGWAADLANPNRYLQVWLRLNGTLVAKACACMHRRDLGDRIGIGLHGFAFPTPKELRQESTLKVEVLYEDGRLVGHTPAEVDMRAGLAGQIAFDDLGENELGLGEEDPCVLFMHIPKTAGTAIQSTIRTALPRYRRLFVYPHPPGIPAEHLPYLSSEQFGWLRCVFGHFTFGVHRMFKRECKYATILRHPVERSISHCLHVIRNGSDPPNSKDLAAALEENCSLVPDNIMVRMIAGLADNAEAVTTETLRLAINNLKEHFAVVGILGAYYQADEAFQDVFRLVRLQPQPVEWLNRGGYDKRSVLSPKIERIVVERNRYDIALYQFALNSRPMR